LPVSPQVQATGLPPFLTRWRFPQEQR